MLNFRNKKTIVSEYILDKLPIPEHAKLPLDRAYLDIGYKLNKSGYRCDEFDIPYDISVVTIGCSNSFGYSIENKHRFSELFISKLANHTNKKIANWNLSFPAKSNDYIARITLAMPHTLKPDIILVSFTGTGRREYFDANFNIKKNKRCYDHIPLNLPENIKPYFLKISKKFINMSSPHEDFLNFYKNYKLVEMICELHNIQFLFTVSCFSEETKHCNYGINEELYVGPFSNVDLAKDNQHPGIKSHKKIANKFWRKYKNVYMD